MKTAVISVLRAYKWLLSPLLLPACRYVPSCSEYAEEAIERYGVLLGGWMAALRLFRCHPFVKGGYDPVIRETVSQQTRFQQSQVQQVVREEFTPASSTAR